MATGKTKHQFCGLHRIGYDATLDPTCPQCTLAHIGTATQYDYDTLKAQPLDDSGKPLDARTLKPVAA